MSIFHPLPDELNCVELGNRITLKFDIQLALPIIEGKHKPL